MLLVGVGGGVPNYTDYTKHVRLGDVVLSSPLHHIQGMLKYAQLSS